MPPKKGKKRERFEITTDESLPFYGQQRCSKEGCNNGGYYIYPGQTTIFCGTHSRKRPKYVLRKDPSTKQKKKEQLEARQQLVVQAAAENKRHGRKGHVIVSGFKRYGAPHQDGYLKVFPNNKHQNRKDGYGCRNLSPMVLGPVHHEQKGLDPATSIENFHQFNKVFRNEVDENGDPLPIWYEMQQKGYADPVPHRHKYPLEEMKKIGKDGNKNRCLYSIHNGKRYSYVESRQFYCKHYERLAKEKKEYKELKQMIADGTNLQITGYDGYEVTEDIDVHYNDPHKPFGHELVLYTLLTVEDPADYPWNHTLKN